MAAKCASDDDKYPEESCESSGSSSESECSESDVENSVVAYVTSDGACKFSEGSGRIPLTPTQ